MCLYPRRITNRKYIVNEKNEGIVPELPIIGKDKDGLPIYDERILQVEIPCGRCIECCKAKAREWQVRLSEEIKDWEYMYFVTFTFSPEGLREILFKYGIQECNAAAAHALRRSLERYRKDKKCSYRHWFITELGHEGTERIHMHGIIFMKEKQDFELIERKGDGWMAKWKYWKYGHIFVGDYVNQKSVNYVVKYMHKIDSDHKNFVGQVLCSPGIGHRWIEHLIETGEHSYTYKPRATKDFYRLNNGSKVKLPKYYGNKLWNEEERELKWREFLDRDAKTITGNTYYQRETPITTMGNIEAKAQEVNENLNYGNDSKEWRKMPHNITKRMLQDQERKRQMEIMSRRIRENNYKIAKKMQENLQE